MSEKMDYGDMVNKIKELQDNYYSVNKKKMFFKKSQKLDCANVVSENIPLELLLIKTIFIVPNTNKIYFDYTFFKLYANPENFTQATDYFIAVIQECININGNYQFHINLDTFTVSAVERYKPVILGFLDRCLSFSTEYSAKAENVFVYNTPKNIDNIASVLKAFIDKEVYKKILLFNQVESSEIIKEFQNIRDTI